MACYWNMKTQANVLSALGLITALGISVAQAELREFTDAKGRKLKAEFMDLQGTKAALRLATGKIVAVELEKLSKADQEFINNHPAAQLNPVNLPATPLYGVTDWNERQQAHEIYFIDSRGKRAITRRIKKIHEEGFASCLGDYAVIEGPNLGVIDVKGSAQFGVSAVGPPSLQAGSDAPIFIANYGKGETAYSTYLRKDGKPFIKRRFASARPFNSERAWVNIEAQDRPRGRNNGLWTLIDYAGNLLHAFEDLEVQDFSEGRAGVALDTQSDDWAIINTEAEVIAEGPFRRVGRFIDGVSVVDGLLMNLEGEFLMEKSGEWTIERRHEISESDAIIGRRTGRNSNKTRYAILRRSTAEHIIDIPDDLYIEKGFFDGLAVVRDNKTAKLGYMTRTGVMLVEPQYADARRFRNGFAEIGIKSAQDLAVINPTGAIIWKPNLRERPAAPKPKKDEKPDDEKKGGKAPEKEAPEKEAPEKEAPEKEGQ
jgi:hypothetical protein